MATIATSIKRIKIQILICYYTLFILFMCIKNKNKNILITVGPGIGDVLFSLSFANAIDKKETIFICDKSRQWLFDLYDFKNIRFYPVTYKQINHMTEMFISAPKNKVIKKLQSKNLYIANALAYYSEKALWSGKCGTMLEILKEKVYHCPNDMIITRPKIPHADVKVYIPEKSVLLSMSSNSSIKIDMIEWNKIVKMLNTDGYNVFLNCTSQNDEGIEGTEKLVLDLISMYNIIDRFEFVIGLRSGFQDYIVDRAKNIISVNSGNMFPNFTLKQWGIGASVYEFNFDSNSFEEDIKTGIENLLYANSNAADTFFE